MKDTGLLCPASRTVKTFLFTVLASLGVTLGASLAPPGTPLSDLMPEEAPEMEISPEDGEVKPETPPEPETDIDEPTFRLNGFILVGDKASLVTEGITKAELSESPDNIWLNGVTPPNEPALRQLLAEYIGEEVTVSGLDKIRWALYGYYQEHGRSFVAIYFPEQKTSDGIFQILIIEGRVGEITIRGNQHFDSEIFRQQIRAKTGSILIDSQLNKDIEWINTNPFRRAQLAFAPGAEEGATDIIVQVKDKRPIRTYVTYENTGNQLTDYDRYIFGLNWGDAFWQDHQMNYQFTASEETHLLMAHSVSYRIPLPWRKYLTLIGSYAKTEGDFPDPTLTLDGESWQISTRYSWSLENIHDNQAHNFTVGTDFKNSDNTLLSNQLSVSDTVTQVVQGSFGYGISRAGENSMTSLNTTLIYSPGNLASSNNDKDFAATSVESAEYLYGRMDLNHRQSLFGQWLWVGKAGAQLTNSQLPGSEKIGIGGKSTIRGYDSREGNGDVGYFISSELRTPKIPIPEFSEEFPVTGNVQLLWFIEYGDVRELEAPQGTDRNVTLLGTGPGLRATINKRLSMQLDYGFQLKDSGASTISRDPRNHRGHITITLSL